jgi:hypothetical protein
MAQIPSGHQLGSATAGLTCLRELRTGYSICRSREQWREIAARLERGERWR